MINFFHSFHFSIHVPHIPEQSFENIETAGARSRRFNVDHSTHSQMLCISVFSETDTHTAAVVPSQCPEPADEFPVHKCQPHRPLLSHPGNQM